MHPALLSVSLFFSMCMHTFALYLYKTHILNEMDVYSNFLIEYMNNDLGLK